MHSRRVLEEIQDTAATLRQVSSMGFESLRPILHEFGLSEVGTLGELSARVTSALEGKIKATAEGGGLSKFGENAVRMIFGAADKVKTEFDAICGEKMGESGRLCDMILWWQEPREDVDKETTKNNPWAIFIEEYLRFGSFTPRWIMLHCLRSSYFHASSLILILSISGQRWRFKLHRNGRYAAPDGPAGASAIDGHRA